MTFTLKVDTDNAAFSDAPDELGRILRDVADAIRWYPWKEDGEETGFVRDVNGNRVGFWTFSRDEDATG